MSEENGAPKKTIVFANTKVRVADRSFPLRVMENLLKIVRLHRSSRKQKCIAADNHFQDMIIVIMFISITFTIIVIISSIVIINIMIILDDLNLTNFSLPCVSLFSAFGVLHVLIYRSCICISNFQACCMGSCLLPNQIIKNIG